MSDRYLAIAPEAEWQQVDGSVLVLHYGLLLQFSGSSAEIWQAIDGSMTVDELASLLSERHPESLGVFEDVQRFVDELTLRRLLIDLEQPVEAKYRVPEHVAWVAEDDGSVALADLDSGRRHSLGPVGGAIWTMTAEGSPAEAIEQMILGAFPDAPASHAEDVDRLLDSLVDAGLLVRLPQHRPASR